MTNLPLARSGLRLWGALLLFAALLTGFVTRGAADPPMGSAAITYPGAGGIVNGVVEFRAEGQPAQLPAPYGWYHGMFTVRDVNGNPVAEYNTASPTGNQYKWEWQSLAGDYVLHFSAGYYNPATGEGGAFTATPVPFQVGTGAPQNPHKGRVVNNGNLCGCQSGCASTRSSTLPRNGDQSWDIPVTSWS